MSISAPYDWSAFWEALYDWFSGATSLTTIRADEGGPFPAYPYATLKIIAGPTREGGSDQVRKEYVTTTAAVQATAMVTITGIVFAAGDKVTINGVHFVPGTDFATGASAVLCAASLAAAVNASPNVLIDGLITAEASGAIVTLTAVTPGTAGNAYTLTKVDTGAANFTLSGATFAGGTGSGPTTGQEVQYRLVGTRSVVVSCQVLTNSKDDDNDPEKHAVYYLSKAQASLAYPSVRKTLADGKVVVVQEGNITNLTGVVDADFITRAAMDVTFRVPFEIAPSTSQSAGYIKTIEATADTDTPGLDFEDAPMGDI